MTPPSHLEAFVRAHHQRAVRIAFRLLGDEQAARDVAQDAFLRASDRLDGLKDPAALESWYFRLLVRLCHNRRRWLAVRRWLPLYEAPDPGVRGDPVLRRELLRALDRLSNRQRTAFVLVRLEGQSIAEAAALLGCAEGTCKSHLHRALVSLREDLAGSYEEVR